MSDKKPSIGLLIGVGKDKGAEEPEGVEEEKQNPEEDRTEDFEAMAQEILDAVKSDDVSALAKSLRSFAEVSASEALVGRGDCYSEK